MKRFLFNILKFCLLLLLVNHVIYILGQKFYFDEYEEVNTSFNKYILADSHGFVLNDLPETYNVHNFSSKGDNYLDMERKLDFLIENSSIDTLYITIDDHTISDYRADHNNLDRSIIYTNSSHYDNKLSYFGKRYIHHYLALLQPKLGKVLTHKLSSYAKSGISNKDVKKKKWYERSDTERKKSIDKRIQIQFPTRKTDQNLKTAFKRIISKCKLNNIVVFGVYFPVVQEYKKAIPTSTSFLKNQFKDNPSHVLSVNDSIFNAKDFKDQDHLNITGSKKFIELLFR